MLMSSVTVNWKNLILPLFKNCLCSVCLSIGSGERESLLLLYLRTQLSLSLVFTFSRWRLFSFLFRGAYHFRLSLTETICAVKIEAIGWKWSCKIFIIMLSGVPKCTLYAPLIFCAGQVSKRKILPHYQHIQNHITLPLPIITAI